MLLGDGQMAEMHAKFMLVIGPTGRTQLTVILSSSGAWEFDIAACSTCGGSKYAKNKCEILYKILQIGNTKVAVVVICIIQTTFKS